jgi:hypothetical protein
MCAELVAGKGKRSVINYKNGLDGCPKLVQLHAIILESEFQCLACPA